MLALRETCAELKCIVKGGQPLCTCSWFLLYALTMLTYHHNRKLQSHEICLD